MGLMTLLRRPSQVFFGWRVLALACAMGALGGGFFFRGFTVFFLPVSQSLGLSRATTGLVFSLARSAGAFEGPVVGRLVDRFGSRTLLIAGILLGGVGYLLLSQVNTLLPFLLVYLGLVSLGFNTCFSHSLMALINTWFIRHRTLAIAILVSAIYIGGAVIVPLLSMAVLHLGWQAGAAIAGITILTLAIPLSLMVRRSPESMGLLPDGKPLVPSPPGGPSRVERETSRQAADELDFEVRQALRTRAYWLLLAGTVLRQVGESAYEVHFIPILVWKVADAQMAANLLGLLLFLTIPLQLFLGWLGDRVPKHRILALGMAAETLGFLLLLRGGAAWHLFLFIPLLAAGQAVNPLNWAAIGDFFGRKSFATLRGIITFSYSWALIVSPFFAGRVFDQTQSYNLSLWVIVASLALASLAFAVMRKPRRVR